MPEIDIAKRRRIMQRSMKLGHCICDPRRPCPCDVFTEQGICPCAGERPDPIDLSEVRLTEMVHNAGCASKIPAADLERVLARLPLVNDDAVVSGLPAGDDAGIYRFADGVHLVQTVDVFTPCVDDPETFGRICAANCLSDIYAMGGVPKTALSVLAFPSETHDGEIMYRMLKGAMETLAEADCALLGGHSIKDEEIKLGFAITGTIDADRAVALETARPGDVLVLTKPLGVGVLNFARQIGRANEEGLREAEASMETLNRGAAEAMNEVGVSACTDVTGFGLFGHLVRMARHSGVTARVVLDRLPAFTGALDVIGEGVIPGAIERNREFVGSDLVVSSGADETRVNLGFDAQTSGGLLISLPEDRCDALLQALSERGVTGAVIGRITAGSEGHIEAVMSDQTDVDLPAPQVELPQHEPASPASQGETQEACCAEAFGEGAAEGTGAEALRAFGSLMRATGTAGRIDARAKELINFALVVLARCEPCIEAHWRKALGMGIAQEELEEAAWCAVAMGGAPVRLFYQEFVEKVGSGDGKACC
jgi:selenide, water dikinase